MRGGERLCDFSTLTRRLARSPPLSGGDRALRLRYAGAPCPETGKVFLLSLLCTPGIRGLSARLRREWTSSSIARPWGRCRVRSKILWRVMKRMSGLCPRRRGRAFNLRSVRLHLRRPIRAAPVEEVIGTPLSPHAVTKVCERALRSRLRPLLRYDLDRPEVLQYLWAAPGLRGRLRGCHSEVGSPSLSAASRCT